MHLFALVLMTVHTGKLYIMGLHVILERLTLNQTHAIDNVVNYTQYTGIEF